jgi:hypothetical protein
MSLVSLDFLQIFAFTSTNKLTIFLMILSIIVANSQVIFAIPELLDSKAWVMELAA